MSVPSNRLTSSTRKQMVALMVIAAAAFAVAWMLLMRDQSESFAVPRMAEPLSVPAVDDGLLATQPARIRNVLDADLPDPFALAASGFSEEEEIDEEWASLRRSSSPAVPRYLFSRRESTFRPEVLYRHLRLNPRDKYIPKAAREQLKDVATPYLERIGRVDEIISEAVVQFMRQAIRDGRKAPLKFKTDAQTAAFLKKHASPGRIFRDPELYVGGEAIDRFYGVGTTLYGVSHDEVPGLTPLVEYRTFLATEFAVAIGNWFVAHDTLPQVMFGQYLEEVITQERR